MIMPLMTFQWAYLSIKTGNLPGLIVIGFFWTLGALAWKRYFDTIRGMNDDKD